MINIFLKNKVPNSSQQGGYSIVEVLFYIAIFVLLSLAVINTLITMTKAFRENAVLADIVESSLIVERITREIKQAISIASISPTVLRLNTLDEAGAAKIVQFSLLGNDIVLSENDVTTGNLNTPRVAVGSLSFTQITTSSSLAVKVDLSISSTRDSLARSHDYHDTAVLRGSY